MQSLKRLGSSILVAFALCGLLGGCVIIPLPEFGGQGRNITPEEMEGLKIGITARDEVLSKLGEPHSRISTDAVFLYIWTRVIGFAAGMGGSSDVADVRKLCLEFDPNGILIRKEFWSGGMLALRPTPLCLPGVRQDKPG
jgi:outer membrane protein assembly factor BamE (lipoprotein component of BamABCDE complex)